MVVPRIEAEPSFLEDLGSLAATPFRWLYKALALPGKLLGTVADQVGLGWLARTVVNPLTVAGGLLAGGYHTGLFNNLNTSLGGVPLNFGDYLNYGGQTASVGAQNFWNVIQRDAPVVGTGTDNTIYGQREGQTFMPGWNIHDPTPND